MFSEDMRCDQHRWAHKKTYAYAAHEGLKRLTCWIDLPELLNRKCGDERFKRIDYHIAGDEQYFIIHYEGDSSVSKPFPHRNAKQTRRPFVSTKSNVKDEVLKQPDGTYSMYKQT